jgi:hypothetical protein
MLTGEVQMWRAFRETRRLGISHRVVFLIEPHEELVRSPLFLVSVRHRNEAHHHARVEMEGEVAGDGAPGI